MQKCEASFASFHIFLVFFINMRGFMSHRVRSERQIEILDTSFALVCLNKILLHESIRNSEAALSGSDIVSTKDRNDILSDDIFLCFAAASISA